MLSARYNPCAYCLVLACSYKWGHSRLLPHTWHGRMLSACLLVSCKLRLQAPVLGLTILCSKRLWSALLTPAEPEHMWLSGRRCAAWGSVSLSEHRGALQVGLSHAKE